MQTPLAHRGAQVGQQHHAFVHGAGIHSCQQARSHSERLEEVAVPLAGGHWGGMGGGGGRGA